MHARVEMPANVRRRGMLVIVEVRVKAPNSGSRLLAEEVDDRL